MKIFISRCKRYNSKKIIGCCFVFVFIYLYRPLTVHRLDMPPLLSSLCGHRSASRRRADRNVAVVAHGQYVPTRTAAAAWRVNTAVSKAAWWPWPLTFWPWEWCPSHVWRGLLCANFSLPRPLCSRLRPDVRDRRQTDRQTSDSIIALCPRLLGTRA